MTTTVKNIMITGFNKTISPTKKTTEPPKVSLTFYSLYGYIQVYECDYLAQERKTIPFTSNNNLVGSINRDNLLQTITINLKTFHGLRKTYSFTVNINSSIDCLLNLLYEEEDKVLIPSEFKWLRAFQYHFVSAHKSIRELNPKTSFYKNLLLDKETIILLPQKILSLSEKMKGEHIALVYDNKIALKITKDEPQYILGDMPINHGKFYYEVTLVTEPIARSVIVGIAVKKVSTNLNAFDVTTFYGFVLSELKRMSSINFNIVHEDYGLPSKIGDKIGVLIDFNEDGVDLSFYINKQFIGIAYNKLPIATYFPCLTLGLAGSKVMISNQVEFPDA